MAERSNPFKKVFHERELKKEIPDTLLADESLDKIHTFIRQFPVLILGKFESLFKTHDIAVYLYHRIWVIIGFITLFEFILLIHISLLQPIKFVYLSLSRQVTHVSTKLMLIVYNMIEEELRV